MIGFTGHIAKIFKSRLQRKISLIDNKHNSRQNALSFYIMFLRTCGLSQTFLLVNFSILIIDNVSRKKYPSIFSHEIE